MFSASGLDPYLLFRCAGGSCGIQPGDTRSVPEGTGTKMKVYGGAPAKLKVKLSTSSGAQWHLPFPLAVSSSLSAQRAASQTGSGGGHRGPVNCSPNPSTSFHLLYGASNCFTLPAQKCITAITKTLELAIWATPKWEIIRNICQPMLNLYYDLDICAHSMLPRWSQPHMHVTCFSKLSCLLRLCVWLNISWNIEGYFLTCSETWISFTVGTKQ